MDQQSFPNQIYDEHRQCQRAKWLPSVEYGLTTKRIAIQSILTYSPDDSG